MVQNENREISFRASEESAALRLYVVRELVRAKQPASATELYSCKTRQQFRTWERPSN